MVTTTVVVGAVVVGTDVTTTVVVATAVVDGSEIDVGSVVAATTVVAVDAVVGDGAAVVTVSWVGAEIVGLFACGAEADVLEAIADDDSGPPACVGAAGGGVAEATVDDVDPILVDVARVLEACVEGAMRWAKVVAIRTVIRVGAAATTGVEGAVPGVAIAAGLRAVVDTVDAASLGATRAAIVGDGATVRATATGPDAVGSAVARIGGCHSSTSDLGAAAWDDPGTTVWPGTAFGAATVVP